MANNKKPLKIGNETYLMTFGLSFLERLNEKYSMEQSGMDVSFGVPKAMVELQMGNAALLADIIRFATADLVNPPSEQEIEDYVYEQTEDPDTEVFATFFDNLMLAPGAKRMLKLTEQAAEKEMKANAKK